MSGYHGPHKPSPWLKKSLDFVAELKKTAEKKGHPDWRHLPWKDLPPAWSKGRSKKSQKRTATESAEASSSTREAVDVNVKDKSKRKEESEALEPPTKRVRTILPKLNGFDENSIDSGARPSPLPAPQPRKVLHMENFLSPQLSQAHPTLVRPASRRPMSLHTVPPPETRPPSSLHKSKIVIDLTTPQPSTPMHLALPLQSQLRKISQSREQWRPQPPVMRSGTRLPPSAPFYPNLLPGSAAPPHRPISMQPATTQHYEQLLSMPPSPHPALSQRRVMHSGPPLPGPLSLTPDLGFTFRAPAPPHNNYRSIAPQACQQLPKTFPMLPQQAYEAPNIPPTNPRQPHPASNTTAFTPYQPESLAQVTPSTPNTTQQSSYASDYSMDPAMIAKILEISPSKQLTEVSGWDFLDNYFKE